MEDKAVKGQDIIWSLKRMEFLLEQILCNTIGDRYSELPEGDRKSKIDESLGFVLDDMKSFFESLPHSDK